VQPDPAPTSDKAVPGLTVELRLDPNALPGDVVGALVQLILARVRRELAAREAPGKEARVSDKPGP
jgi:hypothetical protein